jgi:hypothetical protein
VQRLKISPQHRKVTTMSQGIPVIIRGHLIFRSDQGGGEGGWPGDPGFGAPPNWGTWGGAGQPGFGQPPGIWGGAPNWPSHPIAPGGPPPWVSHPIPPGIWPQPPGGGGQPPGIWGGGNEPFPTPPIYIEVPPGAIGGEPPTPTHPIYIPVYPAHPIVIPPGSIGEGVPEHPIYLPPVISGPPGPWPTPPIYIPPGGLGGDPPKPAHPIWLPTYPAHPIVIPPDEGGGVLPPPEEGKMYVVLGIPGVGWKVAQVPIPGPGYNPPSGGAVPTPQTESGGGRRR